jgi:hypothetical protein
MRRRRQHLCSTAIGRNRAPKANGVRGGDNVRKLIQSHLINHIRQTSGRQRAEENLDFRCCSTTTRQSIAHHLKSELQVRDKMQVRDKTGAPSTALVCTWPKWYEVQAPTQVPCNSSPGIRCAGNQITRPENVWLLLAYVN